MDLRSERVFEYGLIGAGVNNMQMLATRGFAVLAPDTKIDTKDQMRDLARVLLPAVDQVVAEGIADSTRVGIIGHSWGGYTVISLLVQSSKFRAAVMRGGFSNIVADYGVMVANGSARSQNLNEYEYGGTLWEQRQRYIDNSPVFLLDRVTTPLLIIHGGAETTVPVNFADEVFVDLRRLGRDVEYARYEGENHGETAWTYPNQRDYVLRIMQWFESLLKDKTL
jgi:dipeptidyl aminopeptidase/acylaminoacyl peptidase